MFCRNYIRQSQTYSKDNNKAQTQAREPLGNEHPTVCGGRDKVFFIKVPQHSWCGWQWPDGGGHWVVPTNPIKTGGCGTEDQ